MYMHKASDHTKGIGIVHNYVKTNETCEEFYNKDVREFFEIFEKKTQQGYFEDLDNVGTFIFTDMIKISLKMAAPKGQCQEQKLSSKMRTAIGTWSIGVQSSNNIIHILTFCYNINTGIQQCANHDSGHPWINLID